MINYIIELAQLQNKLHVPAKDKLDISVHFRVMPRTNLLHTRTYARVFRLRKLRNIENH